MQNKIKIKLTAVVFLLGGVLLFSNIARAENSSLDYEKFGISKEQVNQMTPEERAKIDAMVKSAASQEVVMVADVNIYDAKIAAKEKICPSVRPNTGLTCGSGSRKNSMKKRKKEYKNIYNNNKHPSNVIPDLIRNLVGSLLDPESSSG